jgi:hypothetical protein
MYSLPQSWSVKKEDWVLAEIFVEYHWLMYFCASRVVNGDVLLATAWNLSAKTFCLNKLCSLCVTGNGWCCSMCCPCTVINQRHTSYQDLWCGFVIDRKVLYTCSCQIRLNLQRSALINFWAWMYGFFNLWVQDTAKCISYTLGNRLGMAGLNLDVVDVWIITSSQVWNRNGWLGW